MSLGRKPSSTKPSFRYSRIAPAFVVKTSRQTFSINDEGEGGDRQRLRGCPNQGQVAVSGKQVEVGVDVVLCRDGIKDEIEAESVLLHLVRVAGHDNFIGSQAKGVLLLVGRSWQRFALRLRRRANTSHNLDEAMTANYREGRARELRHRSHRLATCSCS